MTSLLPSNWRKLLRRKPQLHTIYVTLDPAVIAEAVNNWNLRNGRR